MMNITPHFYPYYPKRLISFHGLPSFMPISAGFEGEGVQGSGCGYGDSSLQGAMGEFIERRHFFTEVPIDQIAKIHDYNNEKTTNLLYHAINQIKEVKTDPSTFDFQLVKVKNIFDDTEAYIPKRFVSLGKITLEDEKFIPMMDSSGIAVHGTEQQSLQAALNEFVERQSLVGSWLSQSKVFLYDGHILTQISEIKRLAEELMTQGNLYIFNIGGDLPGYTIVICYFSKSAKDKVQYVLGVATSNSLDRALTSAFMELWQDYIYIYCYTIYDKANSGKEFLLYAGDTYHMSHFQDNTQLTKNIIPYFNRAVLDEPDLGKSRIYDHQEMLFGLKQISTSIYAYCNEDVNEGLYYTRVISPDFYLHMSIHKPLNFMNSYAQYLNLDGIPSNRQRIPFP